MDHVLGGSETIRSGGRTPKLKDDEWTTLRRPSLIGVRRLNVKVTIVILAHRACTFLNFQSGPDIS
ncbi:hypothetical protein [Bradyrhizobium betae]|uniref:hypothetical protein n=1 Tax=Bradyrhizobium betae TaxID=244734 RepID=UPI0012B69C45|nr:hypothetical protein [Bradyrhizobium betae]MCS3725460.1 hypothetical protein [Bradyrhizobium betae]